MNNFTRTETLPKSGHVNEVCKEWTVREDSALAYKLQSQEINDFYKGNRFRNAVVREDFPTAMHEQIKEKENAEKQSEMYRRRLQEQEQHDKRVAKEIADKLERDLQEQRQQELHESEMMAQQMQQIYVNLPPVPPPAARQAGRPPPRPAKASSLQSSPPTTHERHSSSSSSNGRPSQAKKNSDSFQDGSYVSVSLAHGVCVEGSERYKQMMQQQQSNGNSHLMKLSPEKYDQLVGNGNGIASIERHMQAHADDIELYVDPCDYASLKEIGLPMHEIKEMSKKLKQEQKDALLARRLQEMESHDGLTQEERDRLLAIEAQDKELAKMLQEREKAKAKRAKEKARLRKSQQKDSSSISSGSMCPGSVLHCGQMQDCLSPSNSPHKVNPSSPSATLATNGSLPPPAQAFSTLDDPLDMEAYSNPIDVLHNSQQRMHTTGPLTNGSLTRDQGRLSQVVLPPPVDDDIYTLPVDSCRPGQRPASLSINGGVPVIGDMTQGSYHQNSMSRSENYSIGSHGSGGGDTTISNGSVLHGHDVSPRMNYTKSAAFDKSSSPTPPYMPIQGTRRSNSSEDRKKKSKDKCTHQ